MLLELFRFYLFLSLFGIELKRQLICGDTCVWKSSEKPLCNARQNIWNEVARENDLPEGISCIINGDYKVGELITKDERIPLVSATGSTRMGRIVGAK